MRISDWSSDVCSSDLVIVQHAAAYLERIVVHMGMASDLFVQRIHLNHVLIVRIPDERCDHQAVECDKDLVKFLDFLKAYVGDARPATRRAQIGRASWRDRVGRYV